MTTVRRHDQSVINSYVAEPNLRFLQLSGIALAISEVTQDPALFSPFKELWESLIKDSDRATALLGRAAATLSSESSFVGLTPGGIERSSIEIRAKNALSALGVATTLYDFGGFDDNASPALALTAEATRILTSLRSSHYEGMFYASWLRPQARAAGGVMPSDIEQFLRLLDLDKDPKNG
jgi:hypothetical protein